MLFIYAALLEYLVNVAPKGSDSALTELDMLADAGIESEIVPASVSDKRTNKDIAKSDVGLALNAKSPEFKIQSARESTSQAETTTSYVAQQSPKIVFPAISTPLRKILEKCDSHLYVLIDEWSSIPLDVQPYIELVPSSGISGQIYLA